MGKMEVGVLLAQDEVVLRHDPDAPAGLVDHRDPGKLVFTQDAHDRLDVVLRGHGDGIALHDFADGCPGRGAYSASTWGSDSMTSLAISPSAPHSEAARAPASACSQ